MRNPLSPAWFVSLLAAGALVTGCGAEVSTAPASSPAIPPEPPAPPPPEMTRVTERFFNAPGEDGWGSGSGKNRYVSDATAPIDAPTVLEMPFGPCQDCGGNAMGNQIVKVFDTSGEELYVKFTIKYSSNWEGVPSEHNKIMYLSTPQTMGTPVFLVARGAGQSPLSFWVYQQNQDSSPCDHNPTRNIRPNMSNGRLVRGQWHTIEVYMKMNTRGSSPTCDGVLRTKVDGVLTHDYSDVHYLDHTWPAGDWAWGKINYAPVYGGGTGVIPTRQVITTAYILAMTR